MATRKQRAPEKLRVFIFHGVDIDQDPKEASGICPFCDKDGHFYVETSTGRWHCKTCDEKGNIPVFLQKLMEYSKRLASEKEYKEMSEDRGIPVSAFKECGIVPSFINSSWLVPAYNVKGKLSNVYKCSRVDGKWRVMSSPACTLHPFGVDKLSGKNKIHIVEGLWDWVAMRHTLSCVKSKGGKFIRAKSDTLETTHDVIGVPGAGNFQESWLTYIDGKDAYFWYDNDHPRTTPAGHTIRPGWDGMSRVKKLCAESGKTPRTFHRLKWGKTGHDPARPDGYDYRDLLVSCKPSKAYETGMSLMEQARIRTKKKNKVDDQPSLELIPCESFPKLVKEFEENLHFTQQLRDTLTIMFATIISTDLGGAQIWMRIIGPPGSGKTTLAEALSSHGEYMLPISVQTGFHSGYSVGREQKDNSLIPKMNRRTVVIKDADTLINAPSRDRIMSELRDLYDGTSRAHYRTGQSNVYDDIRTTFLLCGTDELRSLNRTFLGERFLDCEILKGEDTTPYLDRSLKNTVELVTSGFKQPEKTEDDEGIQDDRMTYLKRVSMGCIQHYKQQLPEMTPPKMTVTASTRILAIGQFLSFMRAAVNRDGVDVAYRPRPELATRLVGQFTKMSMCIAVTLGKKTVDAEVLRIITKVLMDTAEGFRLEIVDALYKSPTKSGLSAKELEIELAISEGHVRKLLKDMLEFKIIKRVAENNRSGARGRKRHVFQLDPEMKKLMALAIYGKASRKKKVS